MLRIKIKISSSTETEEAFVSQIKEPMISKAGKER